LKDYKSVDSLGIKKNIIFFLPNDSKLPVKLSLPTLEPIGNESPFYLVRAKNRDFMPTNKRLTHQPITRKTIVCKTMNLIPFILF